MKLEAMGGQKQVQDAQPKPFHLRSPLVSKLNEFRRRFTLLKTNKELESEIQEMIPVFRKEAEKLGAEPGRGANLKAHVINPFSFFIRFGPYRGIYEFPNDFWMARVPLGFHNEVIKIACHETMHGVSYGRAHHGWEIETMKSHEKHVRLEEREQKLNAELVAAVEKGKNDISIFTSASYNSILDGLSKITTELASIRWFIPHWIVEGATNAMAFEVLGSLGNKWNLLSRIFAGNYVIETAFARKLKKIAGDSLFRKSFFEGDLALIVDEYCKIKGIAKEDFYNSLSFDIISSKMRRTEKLLDRYIIGPFDVYICGPIESTVGAIRLALLEKKAKSA
jgi:hypothetical protein